MRFFGVMAVVEFFQLTSTALVDWLTILLALAAVFLMLRLQVEFGVVGRRGAGRAGQNHCVMTLSIPLREPRGCLKLLRCCRSNWEP